MGCTNVDNETGPDVHYSIPDGYRGLFVITPDPNAPAIPLKKGVYQVSIPANGHLKVKSVEPFLLWHSTTAAFPGGKLLPVDEIIPADEIKLHTLSTDSDHRHWYLVGTDREKEMSHFMNLHELQLGKMLTIHDLPDHAKGRFPAEQGEAVNRGDRP